MYLIYDILSTIALFLYLPILFTKKGPDSRLTFVKERLGISTYKKTDLWIHAVSMGEVLAALPLLKALKREFPEKKILLSTITYTGQHVAREKFPECDQIIYIPWDASLILGKVISQVSPEIFITIETELWPNLFRILKKQGSKILLMNGRISASSSDFYNRFKFFMKKVLLKMDMLCMQDDISAKRILSFGAPKERVKVIGSFKFDIALSHKPLSWTKELKGPILSAGSTHRGEDIIILKAYKEIKKHVHDTKLVLAPRHPERFREVEELLKKERLHYINRTKMNELKPREFLNDIDVVLLDTIGELSEVYAGSSVAFVGGSLVPSGGHNILEPAYWSKPILIGPYMDNFPIAKDFLEKGAAIEVNNQKEMVSVLTQWLMNKKEMEEVGRKARNIIDKNIGAVNRAIAIIKETMNRE